MDNLQQMPNPFILPAIMGASSIASNLIGQERQAKHNKGLAQFQHDRNMELLKYQLDYNSPKSQMARFAEAGLNPNLIYGQASSGNMQQQSYPNIQPTDMSLNFPAVAQMAQQIQQLELMKTQADLNKVKAGEGTAKTDLINAQKDVVKANPYLNESYMGALIQQMEAKANILHTQNRATSEIVKYTDVKGQQTELPMAMAQAEYQLNLLQKKYQIDSNAVELQDADKKIRAEVLKSKQFQNDLDKVWNDFLKTPNLDQDTISRMLIMLVTKLFK